MHTRVQIVSIVFALLVLTGVFELVRRRYLRERYALLWMSAAVVLLVLAIWKGLLNTVSRAVGIYYPPNAFFVIAFAFLLLLLLHFSAVVSRMSDQNRTLAQRLALMEERDRRAEDLGSDVPRRRADLTGVEEEVDAIETSERERASRTLRDRRQPVL
jgi:hypothetical protein